MHETGANLLSSVESTVLEGSPSRLLRKLKLKMQRILMKIPEGFETGAERL